MNRIYLDHAATTPLLPAARSAMEPWLSAGNPSSLYAEGRWAKAALDESREIVSSALGCLFSEVIFTSGATEATTLAILGAALANEDPRRTRVLFGAAEHHCVLHTKPIIERLGYRVDAIQVDPDAWVNHQALEEVLAEDVLLACVMHANNELGTLSNVESLAEACHSKGTLLFVDAVQTFGTPRLLPSLADSEIDLLAVTAHKLGGPKGCGALYIRAGTKIKSLSPGGGQERELRGGTENVGAIVGFASAVSARRAPSQAARDTFANGIAKTGAIESVDPSKTLSGHHHVRFPGLDGETVVICLDRAGISASSGAACSSGSTEASHVLLACGYTPKEAREGVRFSFGPATTIEEAAEAARRVIQVISELRAAQK